eukprot:CAMPEP_0181056814 /NCGR_PEP_ID=MMETSP1070-20121207/19917_1 /TAXON_ID=265543 /ORGANISM="Minutocellus polymorphus, Strain NH13" /LENGTH=90 /DNA_ID=CAMNT_0023136185 /DNA_START=27 /DNA_END=298 /DNA_ORIENTATION=+
MRPPGVIFASFSFRFSSVAALQIIPMAALLAIPMHLLAFAATVAVGTTPAAELAVLTLEYCIASSGRRYLAAGAVREKRVRSPRSARDGN